MTATQKKETRPEQYLREIRDAQNLNTELLQKLLKYEQKDVSRRHWGTAFKLLGSLLPYAFTLGVTWIFYDKVQDSFAVILSMFDFIPSFSLDGLSRVDKESFSPASIDETIKNATDGASNIWNNKDDYIDAGKEVLNTIDL